MSDVYRVLGDRLVALVQEVHRTLPHGLASMEVVVIKGREGFYRMEFDYPVGRDTAGLVKMQRIGMDINMGQGVRLSAADFQLSMMAMMADVERQMEECSDG